jgi:hypothetical protein
VPQKRLRGGLEPPNFIIAVGLLATAFGSSVVSTYAALGPPPPASLDSTVVAVFSATAFGSSIALEASFVTAAVVASFTAAAAVAAGSSVVAAAAASLAAASGACLFQI